MMLISGTFRLTYFEVDGPELGVVHVYVAAELGEEGVTWVHGGSCTINGPCKGAFNGGKTYPYP